MTDHKAQTEFEITQLNLKKKTSQDLFIETRKVSHSNHSYPIVTIPKNVLETLGVLAQFLNGELYIEYCDPNPLKREIKIRFGSPKQLEQK